MIERTSFDTPILPRLSTIINELNGGVYVIPEFQRPSVWRDEQRLALLDSIVKGLPIGSLLVWRSATRRLKTYPKIAGIKVPELREGSDKYTYLIDGHQRISTLFGALVRPPVLRTPEDARGWPLYYELGTEESPAFRLPPTRGPVPLHWLPLDILLDGKALYRFREGLFKEGEDDKAEEAERIANVFKDYIIPVVPLVTEDLDLVTDAFVRINSQGSGMTEAHMLRALTYLKEDIDTDKGFRQIRDAIRQTGWGSVPDQTLVNCLKASFGLDVYRSSVRELNDRLREDPTALKRLEDALVESVELLRSLGVAGWGALPYAYQLVTLAALACAAPGTLAERSETLHRWFWRTTYGEYFTGQTGGQIRRDIELLARAPAGEDSEIGRGAEVQRIARTSKGTVRTKAYLLFLAHGVEDPDARAQAEQAVALNHESRRSLPVLFPGSDKELRRDPGNLVNVSQEELPKLRQAMKRRGGVRALASRYGLPPEALALLPDEAAFVHKRREILLDQEEGFIRSLGLSLADTADLVTWVVDPEDVDDLDL